MEIQQNSSIIKSNVTTLASSFGIQTSAKAFQILSTNIYTNHILAVVREIICNAVDANNSAKTDTKIKIHTPTKDEPWFSVQDFALGMSETKVRKLYTTYFASDKAEDNDGIGGLGLGSKAPFSYTTQFAVTSVYENKKNIYQLFIDGDIPSLVLVSTTKTTESNGVTVTVPVKSEDYDEFILYTNIVTDSIAMYWNKSYFSGYEKTKEFVIDGVYVNDYCVCGVQINMGGVVYTVNDKKLSGISKYLSYSNKLVICVPIGSVSISPSRESLSLDKTTVEFLSNHIEKVVVDINNFYIEKKAKTKPIDLKVWVKNNGLFNLLSFKNSEDYMNSLKHHTIVDFVEYDYRKKRHVLVCDEFFPIHPQCVILHTKKSNTYHLSHKVKFVENTTYILVKSATPESLAAVVSMVDEYTDHHTTLDLDCVVYTAPKVKRSSHSTTKRKSVYDSNHPYKTFLYLTTNYEYRWLIESPNVYYTYDKLDHTILKPIVSPHDKRIYVVCDPNHPSAKSIDDIKLQLDSLLESQNRDKMASILKYRITTSLNKLHNVFLVNRTDINKQLDDIVDKTNIHHIQYDPTKLDPKYKNLAELDEKLNVVCEYYTNHRITLEALNLPSDYLEL